jgi:hypothetical protein
MQFMNKEAIMKMSSAAVFMCFCLLISIGCSSTPSGTISVSDLQKNAEKYLGQNVVVVGAAEIRTELAPPQMFKLTNKYDYVWIEIPESEKKPPQGYQIRVTGTFQKKQLNIIGNVYCIQATTVKMEI